MVDDRDQNNRSDHYQVQQYSKAFELHHSEFQLKFFRKENKV
jgi:hypothetical protein